MAGHCWPEEDRASGRPCGAAEGSEQGNRSSSRGGGVWAPWGGPALAPEAPDRPLVSPQGCFVFSLVKYVPLTYNKVYMYPTWAIGLGWCLALSSMVCVPLVMVVRLGQTEGPFLVVSTPGPPPGAGC